MLLSAAMIVRDEEPHLARCLTSLRGIVDETVIVDTGSTDRSVEIARAYGATVLEQAWTGDFAAARNTALEQARGRWILYIDADEQLEPVSRAAIETMLSAEDVIAMRLLLHPDPGWTAYREYRVWRNDPRIRFEGVIHEKVRPAIHRAAAEDGCTVADCELSLQHFGYATDQERKHRRNLPLLRAELAARPDTIFNWRHLGVVLAALGDPAEAARALQRAVELARRAPSDDVHGSLAFAELVRLRHARGGDVTELLAEGLQRWPENWLLVWMQARLDIADGRFEHALVGLDRLLTVDTRALAERGVAYDRRLFGVFAHSSRGRCLLELRRYDEAAAAFADAERCDPDDPAHALKRRFAETAARPRAAEAAARPRAAEAAGRPRTR